MPINLVYVWTISILTLQNFIRNFPTLSCILMNTFNVSCVQMWMGWAAVLYRYLECFSSNISLPNVDIVKCIHMCSHVFCFSVWSFCQSLGRVCLTMMSFFHFIISSFEYCLNDCEGSLLWFKKRKSDVICFEGTP